MTRAIKGFSLAVMAVFVSSGCNLLDVDNPNSLTEESVNLPAAANGVANGSLRKVADAVSEIWQTTGVASDELFWTGSRDGWNTLDRGAINEPRNEFIDAAFPELGTAVWMGQYAIDVLEAHVADGQGFEADLARAYLFNGIALLVTGETQEDMTFSNKMEDGAPVGPANMSTVLDNAITNLDEAVTRLSGAARTNALAVRARAHMSRLIWNEINPSASGTTGAMDFGAAVADAEAVLAAVGTEDYRYEIGFSPTASTCSLCSWINLRGENQVNDDLVALTTSGTGASGRLTHPDSVAAAKAAGYTDGDPLRAGAGTSGNMVHVVLIDPVSGEPDPAVKTFADNFGVDQYGDLTVSSARLMHLILAETALAGGDAATFEEHIDAIRDFDSKADFTSGGAVGDFEMLQHERRVNTWLMGLRLPDMFRWGIVDSRWAGTSSAVENPGQLMPIGIVELRANCHLNGEGC